MRRQISIVGVLIIVMIIPVGMYTYIERVGYYSMPQQADTIIVLGAAVWRNGPSPALLERIALAESLYRQERRI